MNAQDSLRDQMVRLYELAIIAKLYDAADAIRKRWIDAP